MNENGESAPPPENKEGSAQQERPAEEKPEPRYQTGRPEQPDRFTEKRVTDMLTSLGLDARDTRPVSDAERAAAQKALEEIARKDKEERDQGVTRIPREVTIPDPDPTPDEAVTEMNQPPPDEPESSGEGGAQVIDMTQAQESGQQDSTDTSED